MSSQHTVLNFVITYLLFIDECGKCSQNVTTTASYPTSETSIVTPAPLPTSETTSFEISTLITEVQNDIMVMNQTINE